MVIDCGNCSIYSCRYEIFFSLCSCEEPILDGPTHCRSSTSVYLCHKNLLPRIRPAHPYRMPQLPGEPALPTYIRSNESEPICFLLLTCVGSRNGVISFLFCFVFLFKAHVPAPYSRRAHGRSSRVIQRSLRLFCNIVVSDTRGRRLRVVHVVSPIFFHKSA